MENELLYERDSVQVGVSVEQGVKTQAQSLQTVLILGGYGFIGSAIARHLSQGYRVIIAGRNQRPAARFLPEYEFRSVDLAEMAYAPDWQDLLEGVDTVINCAGALQDGRGQWLEKTHHKAIAALGVAAETRDIAVVQMSAVGANLEAPVDFLSSKARGDQALRERVDTLWVLKPGLVLGQSAFGGTALIRLLAAIPVLQPLAMAHAQVQTLAMDDLYQAVETCLTRQLPPGTYELVETQPHRLSDIIAKHRKALGFSPAVLTLALPSAILKATSFVADLLGRAGWRSPLRSASIVVLEQGVIGSAETYLQVAPQGTSLRPLEQTLSDLNLSAEHRLAARMSLLMPCLVAVLALFWALSGAIGLLQIDAAAKVLETVGWSAPLAHVSVAFWAIVDLALAGAVLWRPTAQRACLAMFSVSLLYLCAATVVTPMLWLDPLGPLLKILPAGLLALAAVPLLEAR